MPDFEDAECSDGDFCVTVWFTNSVKDMLVLNQKTGTHIYEGHLRNNADVPVVLIDVPFNKKRLVNIANIILLYDKRNANSTFDFSTHSSHLIDCIQ